MRALEECKRLGDPLWMLFGVHSAHHDLSSRDSAQDEALGLNCT